MTNSLPFQHFLTKLLDSTAPSSQEFWIENPNQVDRRICQIVSPWGVGDLPNANDAVKFSHSKTQDILDLPPTKDAIFANKGL